MKLFFIPFLLLLGLVSCASPETDFSTENTLYFLSKAQLIDVLSLEGIDLGVMFRPPSKAVTSKNFGKKGLITYHGILVDEEITIKWTPSKTDNADVQEVVLKRPDAVPEKLPDNTSLVLEYMGNGQWKMYVHPDTMLL